jgi:hypothetical protein
MGLVKEPKDVDLFVENKPMSSKEKKELSDFIKKLQDKLKAKKRVSKLKPA